MSIHKYLIKLNNKLESSWALVTLDKKTVAVKSGWYVCEFLANGNLDYTPRIIINNPDGHKIERCFTGFHAGRNRMLMYLPQGELAAYSESLEFERLARVSLVEGRARILLICTRYLRDFFSPLAVLKIIAIQFQNNIDLSNNLLHFYNPARGGDGYLDSIERWSRYQGFRKQLSLWLNWLGRGVKIAVIIDDKSQQLELATLLVQPDAIVFAGESIPDNIDYCIALSKSEHLRSPALLMLKQAIRLSKVRPNLVYTDHDYQVNNLSSANQEIELEFPLEPVFKPQPSYAYLHCFNYVGFAVIFSTELVNSVGSRELMNDDIKYQLALRAFKNLPEILSISEALFTSSRTTRLQTPKPMQQATPWKHIECLRRGDYNVLMAKPHWDEQPSVDLVIPTRDGMAVLKPCIDSILKKTTYDNFKIIIADNGSVLPETLQYFSEIVKDSRVSIIEYPGEFNYSAINNFAVSKGHSDFVALVNNDIEVIDGNWLTQMMAWAIQDGVGVVGSKLLFGNGKVQHAGVTIGMGNAAGHIHRFEEGDAPGYQLRCLATQNMMAVTAACLITPRPLFEQLGGLDEIAFKVAYNDVDYCLKVESHGYQVIWTPEAVLYHHESVSRGDDMSDQHIERYFRELSVFQSRWKSKGFVDKYYSKHLRISDEGVFPQQERQYANQAQKDNLIELVQEFQQ